MRSTDIDKSKLQSWRVEAARAFISKPAGWLWLADLVGWLAGWLILLFLTGWFGWLTWLVWLWLAKLNCAKQRWLGGWLADFKGCSDPQKCWDFEVKNKLPIHSTKNGLNSKCTSCTLSKKSENTKITAAQVPQKHAGMYCSFNPKLELKICPDLKLNLWEQPPLGRAIPSSDSTKQIHTSPIW